MHPPSDTLLSAEDRRALISRARRAILETVSSRRLPDLLPAVGRLAAPRGAFVTLRSNGKLRGCIGRSDAAHGLAETVMQCAITAALNDPRFQPLRVEEMPGLEIEISVLSELRPAQPEEIQLGIHGICVSRGANRGLLLPHVAFEHNWSTTQFLDAACRKAGLCSSAWREPQTRLFIFTAEVFSDSGTFIAEVQPSGGPI
jgi:AmmeMemoRadiSam system protein A